MEESSSIGTGSDDGSRQGKYKDILISSIFPLYEF